MRGLVTIAASAVLAACSPEGGEQAASPATPSRFQAEIAPILANGCATCHLTGQEAGGMSLVPAKAIASLVDVPSKEAPAFKRVKPGDPDASYLVMKLEGTHIRNGGSGSQMPFGAPALPPEVIASFRQWIKEGAKP